MTSRSHQSGSDWRPFGEAAVYAGAGIAAVLTRAGLVYLAPQMAGTKTDRSEIVLATAAVFFGVVFLFARPAFREAAGPSHSITDAAAFTPKATPQQTSDAMARVFAGVTDDNSRRRAILEWLAEVPRITVLIPFMYYLRFGRIGPLGWGLTVFFDVYCLLWVVGLYFRPRTEYHTPVRLRGDWIDHVGAFWLIGCAFGPFFGWFATEAYLPTPASWRWQYGLRALLAAAAPILLALPLLRYARGKSSRVAVPLLLVITLLPVSTAVYVIEDLWEGPSIRVGPSVSERELYLKHTGRSLGGVRSEMK